MIMSKKSKNIFIWLNFNRAENDVLNIFQTSFQRWIFKVCDFRFFPKLLINKLNIFKTFSNHFSKHSIKLASFYHDRSKLNDKTDFIFSRISRSIMGLPHGVSPITFFRVHNISLYISNPFQTHTIFYLYITQILFILKYRQTSIVCFLLHLCIFKSTFFSYKNSFFSKKTNFHLYITQILFENTLLQIKIRSFVFDLSVHIHWIPLVLKETLFPVKILSNQWASLTV